MVTNMTFTSHNIQAEQKTKSKCHKIWGFHSSEDSCQGLLGYDSGSVVVQYHLHPEDGGSMVLQNVSILPEHYMASQPEDGNSKVLRNVSILPHH